MAQILKNDCRCMHDRNLGYFLSIQPTARKWIGTGIFEMMPSGWRLQNMARVAMIEQPGIDGIDPVNGLVFPKQAALSTSAVEKATANSSPYNWLSSLWFANYNRVLLTTCLLYTSDAADDLLCVDL